MKKKISILTLVIALIAIIGMLFVGCPTSGGTDETTTTKVATTTTTTIIELTTDSGLTFSAAELQQGWKLNGSDLIFGIRDATYDAAMALDPSVKSIKHYGEYWGAWNWGEKRSIAAPTDGYIRVRGTNVCAQLPVSKATFISDTEGYIIDSWGNATKYDWGFKICGANGEQLPDAGNGGTVPNWIAKLSTDTTVWAIKDKDFGGSIDTVNAEADVTLWGATTTVTPFKDVTWILAAGFLTPQWDASGTYYTFNKTSTPYTLDTSVDAADGYFKVCGPSWTFKYGEGAEVTSDGTIVNLPKVSPSDGNAHAIFTDGTGDSVIYTFDLSADDYNASADSVTVYISIKKK